MTNELISPSTVYWITRLDAIQGVATGAAIVGVLLGTVFYVAGNAAWSNFDYGKERQETEQRNNESRKRFRRMGVRIACAGVFFTIVSVLTPSTKQAVAIAVIPAIANNEDVQGLGADLVTTAREWLQELRPEKK